MSKSLSFSLSDYDDAPDRAATWVTLDVDAESAPFRGSSACFLADHHLRAFLDDLELVANGQRPNAKLMGGPGWGEAEEHVRMELFPSDNQGHIRIRVVLAQVPPTYKWPARLEAHFETEPAPLLRFAQEVRRALGTRLLTTIFLYVLEGRLSKQTSTR